MVVVLSRPGKMPCKSWSLQARETCPGAIDRKTKQLVPSCAGCYAVVGNYTFPAAKNRRAQNKIDWQADSWVADMVQELDTERYFRWFDSGDIYSPKLAQKILQIMTLTPWCKHWLPTKSYKFKKYEAILRQMEALPNVVVRRSADGIDGTYAANHGSTVIPNADYPTTAQVCPSYKQEGKCGTCRACWDKNVTCVAYIAHGVNMLAQIKKMEEMTGK